MRRFYGTDGFIEIPDNDNTFRKSYQVMVDDDESFPVFVVTDTDSSVSFILSLKSVLGILTDVMESRND